MIRRTRRTGFTLFELIVVMAILVLVAIVTIPSINGISGGYHAKAVTDQIRGELAAARSWAMQEGIPIRVAISTDGTKIRRAPEAEFDQPAAGDSLASARRVEYLFDKATATVMSTNADGSSSAPTADSASWVTVAVILWDGTCRDDRTDADDSGNQITTVSVREQGYSPSSGAIVITIRGVTGQVSVGNGKPGNGSNMGSK